MAKRRPKKKHSDRIQFFKKKIGSFLHTSSKNLTKFAHDVANVHSSPSSFVSMLAGNKSMSDAQKVRALKTYIRKHGRRSSTLDG